MESPKNTSALLPFPEFCTLPEAPSLLGCSLDSIVQMAVHNEIEICVWFKDEKEVSLILKKDTSPQTAMFLDFILENKVQISERCTFERIEFPGYAYLRHTTIKKIPDKFEVRTSGSNGAELVKRSQHIKYRANTAFIPAIITGLWKIENPPTDLTITRQIFLKERLFYITPSDYPPDYPEVLFRPRSHSEKLLITIENIYITKSQLEKASYLIEEKSSKQSESESNNRKRYAPDREQILLGVLHLLLKSRAEFDEKCVNDNGEINKEAWLRLIREKSKILFRNGNPPLSHETIRDLLGDALLPAKERTMSQNKPSRNSRPVPSK
ncbi:hypothetical protein [Buttiauxella sp. S19-1]|uniref:hypothetical protein n=1 Tax=Buttiauxella sp. S19-1 TaxID=941430 RepID=UPI001EDC2617|nr:hypothetical protein [Buttiauxella sp. S19-1]